METCTQISDYGFHWKLHLSIGGLAVTATPSHTGHISLPQILYINASTSRDEYCLRPGLDVEVPSILPPILYIKAFTVDDEYCLTQLFHQVISSVEKKQSGIFY